MFLIPDSFVFLREVDPTIVQSPRYVSSNNFLGRQVVGYTSPEIVATREAALQLKKVQDDLRQLGYKLVVYDAYRPQRAVNDFIQWSQDPSDQKTKTDYYPTLDKKDMFDLGYLSKKSGHSRGSTIDLTIISINTTLKPITKSYRTLPNGDTIAFFDDNTVDMGASFDLFHEISHHDTQLVTAQHNKMRDLLRNAMKNQGFKEYHKEWWHYTLENEPYPDTYFDFVVE